MSAYAAVSSVKSYLFGLIGRIETNVLQLELKDLTDLSIVEVFKHKRRLHWETPSKSRVNVPKHLLHLVLVSQQKHATILTRSTLNLSDNRVDDSSFVRITCSATSQHIGLVNDENFTH